MHRHHPPDEVARLREQLVAEWRSDRYTDRELADRYNMTERTLRKTVRRYSDAKSLEDYRDRSHAPKDPYRKYIDEDFQQLRDIRSRDEARINKKQEEFERRLEESGKRLPPPKLARVMNDMNKAKLGYRRVARAFTKETGCVMSKSAAQRFLAKPPPEKPKPRRMERPPVPMVEFGADYVQKQLAGGGKLTILNIVDHFNSGIAVLDNHYKQSAWATMASFRELRAQVPIDVRLLVHVDNGKSFDNEIVRSKCETMNIELDFIPKGQPWKNAFCERSNRTVKECGLNLEFIPGVKNAQPLLDAVKAAVNTRENMGLGYRTPAQLWAAAGAKAGIESMVEFVARCARSHVGVPT